MFPSQGMLRKPERISLKIWLMCYCFLRIREEELLFCLRRLPELKIWPGCLWAALSDDPTASSLSLPRKFLLLSFLSHTDPLTWGVAFIPTLL